MHVFYIYIISTLLFFLRQTLPVPPQIPSSLLNSWNLKKKFMDSYLIIVVTHTHTHISI